MKKILITAILIITEILPQVAFASDSNVEVDGLLGIMLHPLYIGFCVIGGLIVFILSIVSGTSQSPQSPPPPAKKEQPTYRVRHIQQVGRINNTVFAREIIQVRKEDSDA